MLAAVSLPPWVYFLMWIPTLALLAVVWILGLPWLAIAGGISLAVVDARVVFRVLRMRTERSE